MATRVAASADSDECEDRIGALSPAALKKKKAKKKSRKPISIFTNGHPLVKLVSEQLNWDDVERDDDWSVAWIDGRVIDKAWCAVCCRMSFVVTTSVRTCIFSSLAAFSSVPFT